MKEYEYYLLITNPKEGLIEFIKEVIDEFNIKHHENFITNKETKLYITIPAKTHVVILYHTNKKILGFVNHIIKKYQEKIKNLNDVFWFT